MAKVDSKPEEVVRFRIYGPTFRATITVGAGCHTVHSAMAPVEYMLLWDSRYVAAYCRRRSWRVERVGP